MAVLQCSGSQYVSRNVNRLHESHTHNKATFLKVQVHFRERYQHNIHSFEIKSKYQCKVL